MDLHKVYYDGDGNPRTMLQLVKQEPEWAANRLQEGERAIEQLAALKNVEPNAASINSAMDAIELCKRIARHVKSRGVSDEWRNIANEAERIAQQHHAPNR